MANKYMIAAIAALVMVGSAYAQNTNTKTKAEIAIAKIEADYQKEKKALEEKYAEQDRNQSKPGASIGMTQKQVIEETQFGKPERIVKIKTTQDNVERWIYMYNQSIFFTNGRVSGFGR